MAPGKELMTLSPQLGRKISWTYGLILVLVIALLTIPPFVSQERGITVLTNWISIGISVLFTWYFSRKQFESSVIKNQRDVAFIAIRRPFEVLKSLSRIRKNVRSKGEAVMKMKCEEVAKNQPLISEFFNGIDLQITECLGHVNQVIADWQGFSGQDIEIVSETSEKIDSIIHMREDERGQMEKAYKEEIEKAKAQGEEQVRTVKDSYELIMKEKEAEYNKKIAQAIEHAREELIKAVARPIPDFSGYSGYTGSVLTTSDLLKRNWLDILADMGKDKCPHCGSRDIELSGLGKWKCRACGREFAKP